MPLAFDTGVNTAKYAARLAGLGYRYAFRYLAHDWRGLTKSEIDALVGAGITPVSIWETNDDPKQFTYDNGKSHAVKAAAIAHELQQPDGSAIYFAVDTDAAKIDTVTDYFEGVNDGLIATLQIGVYGSGLVCKTIRDELALATYSWLANAKGWQGSAGYANPDVLQKLPINPFAPDAFAIDPDETVAEFGQWK